ncbi:TIGR02117 family protein [Yoonia sp. I 8.24]|uniref:TIGR02117 family protein n=1 Tax=Yoonia sp. I 8.24 TaxID=1537229 RepID=UPI00351D87C8
MYLLAGTVGGMVRTGSKPPDEGGIEIGLFAGPIHTDILIPATAQVRDRFGFLAAAGMPINHPDVSWVSVGWGARDFYTTTGDYTDLSLRPVWRAVTGDHAVMRVDLAGPLRADLDVTRLQLSPDQFATLLDAISAGFASDNPIDHPGFNATDRFYPATGRFHLLRTCNVWVGDVLRGAGVRVGLWTPFIWSLP